jgi:hypothetical protein
VQGAKFAACLLVDAGYSPVVPAQEPGQGHDQVSIPLKEGMPDLERRSSSQRLN